MEAIALIAAQAPARLRPGGWLMLEHGATQGAAARACLQDAGFTQTETLADLQGLARITLGRWTRL